eukprot:11289629-Karenia_brevis.AAC.1
MPPRRSQSVPNTRNRPERNRDPVDPNNYRRPKKWIHQNPVLDDPKELDNYLDKADPHERAAERLERIRERVAFMNGRYTT